MLRSHLIEPETLWTDDFEGFLNQRAQVLMELTNRAPRQLLWCWLRVRLVDEKVPESGNNEIRQHSRLRLEPKLMLKRRR